MNQPIDFVSGKCEICSSVNNPEDLYIDLQNNMYHMVCPTCFYKQYNGNDKIYYHKIISTVPDLVSYKVFKKNNKGMIVIANAYPFFKEGGKFFHETERESACQEAVNKFSKGVKIKNKFELVNLQYKSAEQVNKGTGVVLIVAVRAYVRFKSYLEYMEHELYMKFRKDCPTITQ